jgi:hypothetical protein
MTGAQRQAMEDVERHGDPWHRVLGQAQHGGWHGVMRVLQRKRWITFVRGKWALTRAGKDALNGKGARS